jgi:hypothetical protein
VVEALLVYDCGDVDQQHKMGQNTASLLRAFVRHRSHLKRADSFILPRLLLPAPSSTRQASSQLGAITR